jgi:peptidoglycan/LPS O-acetylase OafA/YrhL
LVLRWRHLHLSGAIAAAGYAVIALTLAVAGAICVHLWFERPIGGWLRARLAEFAVRRASLPRAVAS